MSKYKHSLALGAAAALFFSLAPNASAQVTGVYDWPDETAPVLITTPKAVIFLHKDGKPYRVYSYKANKKGGLALADIDRDGKPEIVGFGKPTFAIDTDADPIWSMKKGCKMGLLADFSADERLDIFCSDGRSAKLYSHDNQFMWEAKVGRGFSKCEAGDVTSDLKADIECKMGRKYVRMEGAGNIITTEGDESMIPDDTSLFEPFAPTNIAPLTEGTLYDFNADGTAEEMLMMDGNLLLVKSKSNPKPLAMIDIKAAQPKGVVVKNIDGKPGDEIIAVTDKSIFILSPDGKRSESYALSTRLKNAPLADLQSVYANNFTDDAAAGEAVKAQQAKLSKCYASQVKKSQFAGSGRLIVTVNVDDKGKVKSVKKTHSELPNKKVVSCALGVLKKGKYPAAKEGEAGTLNVTMFMTFRAK